MISSIRLMAVAATVAAAVLPAQAAPLLSLDFDDLTTPLGLNGKVFTTSSGLTAVTFGSGASAKKADAGDPLYDGPPERNAAGQPANVFVVNDADSFKIDVAPGFKVDMLTLDYAVTNLNFYVVVTDVTGKSTDRLDTVGTLGEWKWTDGWILDLSNIGDIQTVEFFGKGLFGIDNLQFDLESCSPNCGNTGTTVPEPASFGIVALALLGAGISSRRRREVAPV